jgi:hypothetical protein
MLALTTGALASQDRPAEERSDKKSVVTVTESSVCTQELRT